jgi:hypothetical protein
MHYTFEESDYDITTAHALDCWKKFLDYIIAESETDGVPTVDEATVARELLGSPSRHVSWFAFRFAQFLLIDRPTFGGPFNLLVFSCEWSDGFIGPSWLRYDQQKQKVVVVFNREVPPLDSMNTLPCRRTATNLLIHEIAHVLKNFASLTQNMNGNMVSESTPIQERSAWWWAAEILQANRGVYAQSYRENSAFDPAGLI